MSKTPPWTVDSDAYVYVIAPVKDGAPVSPCKVGISGNADARLKDLQAASPLRLSIVRTFRMPSRSVAEDVEGCFHELNKEHRLHGEWFDIEPNWAAEFLIMQIHWQIDLLTKLTDEKKRRALQMIGLTPAEIGDGRLL